MKRFFSIMLFYYSALVFSQEQAATFSISYQDETISSVLENVEKQTGYRFFYVEDWLGDTTRS
ncbi:MAG: hypothetical protein WA810_10020 [Maribacter sp.]